MLFLHLNLIYRISLSELVQVYSEIFALVLLERQLGHHQRIFEQILTAHDIP